MRKVAALFLVVNNILVYQPTQTLPKGKEKSREFSLYYPNNIRDNEQRKNTFIGIYAEGKTNSDTQRVSAEN